MLDDFDVEMYQNYIFIHISINNMTLVSITFEFVYN